MSLVLAAAALAAKPTRFAILGDRTGEAQDSVYERIVAQVTQARPEFVITVGDQIEGPVTDAAELAAEWEAYSSIVAGLGAPLHLVAGNNDIANPMMRAEYERLWGRPYYTFRYKDIRVLVLDNAQANTVAQMGDEQLAWLAATLDSTSEARWTMVFMHKPFWEQGVMRGKPDTLHALFKRYGVDAVFTGHYHEYFAGTIDGIKYTSVGSSGGAADPGPTGIGFHWVAVAVDNRKGITITPTREDGSTRQWQDVSLDEKLAIDRVTTTGLRFGDPLEVAEGQAATTAMQLWLNNYDQAPVGDELKWDVPDGWSVACRPKIDYVDGSSALVDFVVVRGGDVIYPVPTVSTKLAYAPGKGVEVSQPLRVSRTVTAFKTAQPVIDGQLREKTWQRPATLLFNWDGKPTEAESTAFCFGWDSANVYLAAWCRESRMDSLRLGATERDGAVYNDDCVGWFLRPDFGNRQVYQVYVNAGGVVFDQSIVTSVESGMESDPEWNGDYEVKTARGKDWWSVEVRVPAAQLGGKAEAGRAWGLNFRRKQQRLGTADWQVPISYDADTYGRMVME
jgi:3',5'-cyclic AMP phosphodiesterase CpdA